MYEKALTYQNVPKILVFEFFIYSNIVHRAFPVLTSLAHLLGARRSATGSSTNPPEGDEV